MANASITMQIEPSPAQLGETLRLTLTMQGLQSNASPDLHPLEQDFSLVGTEHNMSYTAVNGVAKATSQWVILLIANKTGTLTIPPIRIGQEYSTTGQIQITNNSSSTTTQTTQQPDSQNVLLEASTNQNEPMVNEQIIYQVKLYTRVPLVNAQYQPPHVKDALMISLGNGKRYQATVNGYQYDVDEQKYAIFPQKSGKIKIIPPQLSAVIYDTTPKHIHIKANIKSILVKPIPKKIPSQDWLPTKKLTLSEEYDPNSSTLMQGSSIIRTITIQAQGMPAELLPNLSFPNSTEFNIYPEKPETRNVLQQGELIGTSKIKVSYLLNQSGPITIPAIKLSWFNTTTRQQEEAVLPEHLLNITAKSNDSASQKTNTLVDGSQTNNHVKKVNPVVIEHHSNSYPYALWAAGFFALAWVITLVWFWWRNHPNKTKPPRRDALKSLKPACEKNDAELARSSLLAWAKEKWPDENILNLNDIIRFTDDEVIKKQILLLSQALYSKNTPTDWQGNDLYDCIKNFRIAKPSLGIKPGALPPINPI